MAFPTTPILDNFNRANQDIDASANWHNDIYGQGDFPPIIVSNQLKNGSSEFGSAYWIGSLFGPDCEVYCDIVTPPIGTDLCQLALRMRQVGSSAADLYDLVITSASSWAIRRIDNGVSTELGASFTQAISAGDKFGLEAVGSTLTAYYKPLGSPWRALTSRTDTTYAEAGNIGLYMQSSVLTFDNFGGGTVVRPPLRFTKLPKKLMMGRP